LSNTFASATYEAAQFTANGSAGRKRVVPNEIVGRLDLDFIDWDI
jgi:hypothetical protein